MARRKAHSAIEVLIGTQTVIKGDVNFSGGLYLEGRIEGNVNGADAESRFDLNEAGCVVGEVRVAKITVNGKVEGELHASGRLVLGPKARVEGNVFYHVLELAAGAEVNGKLVYRPQSEPLAIEHRQDTEANEGNATPVGIETQS